jgi:hypothetical protein
VDGLIANNTPLCYFRTYLRLPWRPLVAIRGNTTYDLNEDYKVEIEDRDRTGIAYTLFPFYRKFGNNDVYMALAFTFYQVTRHSESWDVSALEAISQIFVSAREQNGN